MFFFFFFKQKTAYEMRISDWSSDVCSSDLGCTSANGACPPCASTWCSARSVKNSKASSRKRARNSANTCISTSNDGSASSITCVGGGGSRSEEHTSELQSLMRISYAVFCLKKKHKNIVRTINKHTRTSEG